VHWLKLISLFEKVIGWGSTFLWPELRTGAGQNLIHKFFGMRYLQHVIPAAAIKQSAPPTAAPITTGRFVLELRLAWLDAVPVRAVQSSNHGQDVSSTSMSGNITKSDLINLLPGCIRFESAPLLQIPLSHSNLY
jgi:hypothetical protein